MRRVATIALLAAVALALVPAAGAAARSEASQQMRQVIHALARQHSNGERRSNQPFLAGLELKTASGYVVNAFGLRDVVGITVERDYGRSARATTYVVRGTVTRGRLQASFGKLGSISMRFRPAASRGGGSSAGCFRGFGLSHRRGVFVGRLHFRGEGDYIKVDVKRAKGSILEIDQGCKEKSPNRRAARARASGSGSNVNNEEESSYLKATWHHGITQVNFLALEDEDGRSDYLASTLTAKGRMAILRTALLLGAKAKFVADDALTHAKLTPPSPFHGSGTFRSTADGQQTWDGDLAVNFPGYPRFPLTGPEFDHVELGRGSDLLLFFLLLESL